jgi:hypothetical protein
VAAEGETVGSKVAEATEGENTVKVSFSQVASFYINSAISHTTPDAVEEN